MEELYLLLVTNKASNIIEDLDTLRLLSKGFVLLFIEKLQLLSNLVVPDIAGTANNLTEDKVTDKCFELITAFDEVSRSIKICIAMTTVVRLSPLVAIANQSIFSRFELIWRWKATKKSCTI